jgi:Cu+-exporting ATPase
MVLDKTGTITAGRLQVAEWWERKSLERRVLSWVAAAEQSSAHPLGAAVIRAAKEAGLQVSQPVEFVESIPGLGIRAKVESVQLLVGNRALMEKESVFLPNSEVSADPSGQRIWVAVDGAFAGWFRVEDQLRAETFEVVQGLHQRGLRTILLSGDQRAIAERIAREAGIEEVHAEVLPDGKRGVVEELQKRGEFVVMVGDGINDAPALVQADLGVAMGGGTAVARQSADVTLVRDDLRALPEAFDLSRRTLRIIRQNLAFAMGYNLLALPLAAGVTGALGWVPGPMLASAAMALSSVSVVLNALRLRGWTGRRAR